MITKLDVVNHILVATGIAKVNTLETQDDDVLQIISSLDSTDVDFQSHGWWFNKEHGVTLVVNNVGEIIIPQDNLEIIITHSVNSSLSPNSKMRYVQRGGKLYDSIKHTFNIGKTLYVDLVTQIDIADMPAVASSYLKHLATWMFFVSDDGDITKSKELEKPMARAWANLQRAQMKALATNALDSPFAAQLSYRIRQSGAGATNPNFPGGRIP